MIKLIYNLQITRKLMFEVSVFQCLFKNLVRCFISFSILNLLYPITFGHCKPCPDNVNIFLFLITKFGHNSRCPRHIDTTPDFILYPQHRNSTYFCDVFTPQLCCSYTIIVLADYSLNVSPTRHNNEIRNLLQWKSDGDFKKTTSAVFTVVYAAAHNLKIETYSRCC